MRNLDLTALRSFVTVAETGGVTRAAGLLHLTQSAVSMQIKRLEEMLGTQLFDRTGRTLVLSATGAQFLGYARRMVDLNDEAYGLMTGRRFEGAITLGVPHDLVAGVIPRILRQFHTAYPRMRLELASKLTKSLKEDYVRGAIDMILTTETGPQAGAETLATLPLVWVGAPDGQAWRARPLRFASEPDCIFRPGVLAALDAAGIAWEIGIDSRATRAVEAGVEADLAVYAQMAGLVPPTLAPIPHGGALPDLPWFAVNFYRAETANGPAHDALAAMVCAAYRALSPPDGSRR